MRRLVVIAAIILSACGGTTTGGNGPETSACAQAFDAAAAVDDMLDSVSDLYPAVRACSLAEWRTEFNAQGGVGFVGGPDAVLANVCLAPEVASTALCAQVQ